MVEIRSSRVGPQVSKFMLYEYILVLGKALNILKFQASQFLYENKESLWTGGRTSADVKNI
jgi:hypothetical protein